MQQWYKIFLYVNTSKHAGLKHLRFLFIRHNRHDGDVCGCDNDIVGRHTFNYILWYYTYGDYDGNGGGGGQRDVHTTRTGDGGFLATETATRYVPGHTPSLYLHDGAHRTGARHGCSYKRAGRYLYEYYNTQC